MNKKSKVLLAVYSIAFFGLVGFLIYTHFFNSAVDFIKTKNVVPVIFAFLLGGIKILTRDKNNSWLKIYKQTYQDVIKDSFEDSRKDMRTLLKALRLLDEDKFKESINLLLDLEKKCKTRNELYSVKLFLAVNNKYLENYEKAVGIYEGMINEGFADSRVFSNLLNCYSELGEYDKAYETGLLAVQADPKNYNACHNFAFFLFRDGNYEEAEVYAKKALEIKNNFIETITLLYIIYSLQGKSEEAALYEKKAMANGRSKKELKETLQYYIGENEDEQN